MAAIEGGDEMAWIAARTRESRYVLSEHVVRFLMAGKLTVAEIEAALQRGRVIEEHRHAHRDSSYLVCGGSRARPIHVLCAAAADGALVVSFAYLPAPPIWRDAVRRNPAGERPMAEALQTCFFCGGELKQVTVGNFDYRLEGRLYVIKNVPAKLCQQCGEKYVEAPVGRRLNALIAARRFTRHEAVGVIDYEPDE